MTAVDRAVAFVVVGTAVAVWPPLGTPFFSAKIAVLVVGVAAIAIVGGKGSGEGRGAKGRTTENTENTENFGWAMGVAALLWLGSVGLSTLVNGGALRAVVLDASCGALLVMLLRVRFSAVNALRAVAIATAVVAMVAIAQRLGFDPFRAFGFVPATASVRMRVSSLLGNPDFVAAYLGAGLFAGAAFLVGVRNRLILLTFMAVSAAAVAACGSFASAPAIGVGVLVLAWAAPAPASRRIVFGVGVVAIVGVALGTLGRSLPAVMFGRVQLTLLSGSHLLDAPLLGAGPGRYAALYAEWTGGGLQDHAHFDVVERALELGWLGSAAFFGVFVIALVARRARSWPRAGAKAGLSTMLARSLVDFPFARPAELALCVILAAIALAPED